MSKSRDRRRRSDRRQQATSDAWPPVPEGYVEWLQGLRRNHMARGGRSHPGTPLPPPANSHTYTAGEVAAYGKAARDAFNRHAQEETR